MDPTQHAASDVTLLCRLRAAVQWLETPRPFASTAVDLGELMRAVAPIVDGLLRGPEATGPVAALAALHDYYAADPSVARTDATLLTEALATCRAVYTAGFTAAA
ncbi:hypothetical protein [Nocardioides pakistanensis]